MKTIYRRILSLVVLTLLAFHPCLWGQAATAVTTVYDFTGGTDGGFPGSLTLGSDANFYGVTFSQYYYNGQDKPGTIFRITPTGMLITLHTFQFDDFSHPLIQGNDGNFYGTAGEDTTIFRLTPGGVFTTLFQFSGYDAGTDGTYPLGALVQGSDGNFYGTTQGLGGGKTNHTSTVRSFGSRQQACLMPCITFRPVA